MTSVTTLGVVVRAAVPGDAEGIVALLDRVAREGSLGVPRAPRRAAEERAALAAVPPSLGGSWVAVGADGATVGHLTAARGPAPYRDHLAELAVAVDEQRRGRGLGGALLDQGLAWAAAHRLLKVCASVFADNAAALRLFKSRGFAAEGMRQGQFRIQGVSRDEIFLARFLG